MIHLDTRDAGFADAFTFLVDGRREAAADVEELEREAPRLGLGEDPGAEVEGLDVVLGVRALAAHVERRRVCCGSTVAADNLATPHSG